MPGTSSRTTRASVANSSSNSIRFPASKKNASGTVSTKPSPMTLLFRREVQTMLSTPPGPLPAHLPADTPIQVIACTERITSSGWQESVQICRGGGEEWVTKTEGERHFFPRVGRVQKRMRGGEEGEEGEQGTGQDQSTTAGEEDISSSSHKSSKKKARKSHRHREGEEEEQQHETPVTSSSRQEPAAPIKKKKSRSSTSRRRESEGDNDDVEFDDGASTETEASHLARTRGGVSSSAMLDSINEEQPSTNTLRRSTRHRSNANEEPSNVKVKSEEDVDDLSSLCGRVDGLEFRSTVDPESMTPAPIDVSSLNKGKGRA